MTKNRPRVPRKHCNNQRFELSHSAAHNAISTSGDSPHNTQAQRGLPATKPADDLFLLTLTLSLAKSSSKPTLMVLGGSTLPCAPHATLLAMTCSHQFDSVRLPTHQLRSTREYQSTRAPTGPDEVPTLAISLTLAALAFIRTRPYHTPNASPTKMILPRVVGETKCLIAKSAMKASQVA